MAVALFTAGAKVTGDGVGRRSELRSWRRGRRRAAGSPVPAAGRRGDEVRRRVLGFVVISKNFLRTRKIMMMHSNERGECCLRTLVDRNGSVDAT